MEFDKILILDFGSQYTQLIARRIRELGVYSEIQPFNYPLEKIREFNPKGIIFSGGPSSVLDKDAPYLGAEIFKENYPILGICYGMQLITKLLGGEVEYSPAREYGKAMMEVLDNSDFFYGFRVGERIQVWMSHSDRIKKIPEGFEIIAKSNNSPIAAFRDKSRKIYGVQFHPEVVHTPNGKEILSNFVFKISGAKPNWNMSSFIEEETKRIRKIVGNSKTILALSGGVDSSVVAALLHRSIGDQVYAVFVNNGLLRKGEAEQVVDTFKNKLEMKNFIYVDAEEKFLNALKGVIDPEKKRKIIGHKFIEIFENVANEIDGVEYLAQGTLYPDVIESVSFKGPSAKIKSHHNVGGLPEKMNLKLLEPLRELFKDEVRKLGLELGLPEEIVYRHPFPGPGLAIRIIGEVTKENLDLLREADAVVVNEIKKAGLYRKIWQAFAVLLPIKSVGVMGDERTYEQVVAVRIVESEDGMTADWSKIPYGVLEKVSNEIVNHIKGINRVVYDISSKPPSTIEWE